MELPVTSLVDEYKAGKVRTVMMLRYSKDLWIREDPPEVRSGRKWSAEHEVDRAEIAVRHSDIDKERRDVVVTEVQR